MIIVGRFLALCVVATSTVALLVAPGLRKPKAVDRNQLYESFVAAESRFDLHSELLRRAHSRALATDAARMHRRDTARVTVVASHDQARHAEPTRRLFAELLGETPRTLHGSRVIVAITSDGDSVVAGVPASVARSFGNNDAFPPGSIADDACFVVVRVGKNSVMDRIGRSSRFRTQVERALATSCRWYAAYGAPGAGIGRWLDSTRYGALKSQHIPIEWWEEEDGRFWSGNHTFVGDATGPSVARCSAGVRNACAPLILAAPGTYRGLRDGDYVDTPGWIGTRAWTTSANRLATTMLFELEREIGPQGFAEFWRSDEDLPAAFARARGESLERWTRSLINGARPAYRAGPAPSPIVSMGLLALIPGLLALGIRGVLHRGRFS